MIKVTNIKLLPKTIDPHQITNITDVYLFQTINPHNKIQTLQILQISIECRIMVG